MFSKQCIFSFQASFQVQFYCYWQKKKSLNSLVLQFFYCECLPANCRTCAIIYMKKFILLLKFSLDNKIQDLSKVHGNMQNAT